MQLEVGHIDLFSDVFHRVCVLDAEPQLMLQHLCFFRIWLTPISGPSASLLQNLSHTASLNLSIDLVTMDCWALPSEPLSTAGEPPKYFLFFYLG